MQSMSGTQHENVDHVLYARMLKVFTTIGNGDYLAALKDSEAVAKTIETRNTEEVKAMEAQKAEAKADYLTAIKDVEALALDIETRRTKETKNIYLNALKDVESVARDIEAQRAKAAEAKTETVGETNYKNESEGEPFKGESETEVI